MEKKGLKPANHNNNPNMGKRRLKEIKGQMQFAFEQKKTIRRIGNSLAEKRAAKETAFRLARQAYAVLSQPQYNSLHYKTYRREIGNFIGACKKGRATFAQAQSKIGMITGMFDSIGIKYRV